MNCVQIEQKGKYTYIKCKKCGQILVTNGKEYSLTSVKKYQFITISSCQHFEVIKNEDRIEIVPR